MIVVNEAREEVLRLRLSCDWLKHLLNHRLVLLKMELRSSRTGYKY